MKHSTTYRHLFRLLSLTLWAALTAACSNDDITSDNPSEPANTRGIPFTATITTGGDNLTRTTMKQETNGKISVNWSKKDSVAMVYKVYSDLVGDSVTVVTGAKVTPKTDNSGKAAIEAKLDSRVAPGTPVTLIYPYSAVDGTTGEVCDDYLSVQDCEYDGSGVIARNYKYNLLRGTGRITLATDSASLSGDVTMASQVCIWRLMLNITIDGVGQSNALAGQTIDLAYGDRTYTLRMLADEQSPTGPTLYRNFKYGDVLYVALLPATLSKLTATSTTYSGDTYGYAKEEVTLAAGKYYQSLLPLDMSMSSITPYSGHIWLQDSDVATGTGGKNTYITIADGATVTLRNLNNTASSYAGIECMGDAHIILEGVNSVKSGADRAGIRVYKDKTLTISGDGSLTATGGKYAAGIGGNKGKFCGHINITGGTITATGGKYAAGIGGGSGGKFGSVTITSGITSVTATHGDGAKLPIGIGFSDQGSDSVTVDGVTPWSGSATEHLNFEASTQGEGDGAITTWTLTRK